MCPSHNITEEGRKTQETMLNDEDEALKKRVFPAENWFN